MGHIERDIESPIGALRLGASEKGIVGLHFVDMIEGVRTRLHRSGSASASGEASVEAERHLRALERQLAEYFEGTRRGFDVPLDIIGTPFQRRVWEALRRVLYGCTSTYARIAREIGATSAVRAAGAANGANPISIVVPCHRVIGADGSLTGYGGGLWRKERLLELEQRGMGAALFDGARTGQQASAS
jgi:O-6-methylguanine DNA methyltransferase